MLERSPFPLTEVQIDIQVERYRDSLDASREHGAIDEGEYDAEMSALNRWAETERKRARG